MFYTNYNNKIHEYLLSNTLFDARIFPEIQYLERAMWLHFHVTKYYDNKLIT